MDITLFIALFTLFSAITSICTEGCKKILDDIKVNYSSNLVVFIIACVVGVCGTSIYYVLNSIEFSIINIVYMLLMGITTSVGAMVGYDKVVQTIGQLKK